MNLELISVLAEAAAAVGVVGSLLFVGYQVRQNSAGLRAIAVQAQTAMFQDMSSRLVDDTDMAEIVWQGSLDIENLKDASLMRFEVTINNVLRAGQSVHWQWQRGLFDDQLFTGLTKALENLAALPGVRAVWDGRRHQYTSSFQTFMSGVMAKSEGTAPYLWSSEKNG